MTVNFIYLERAILVKIIICDGLQIKDKLKMRSVRRKDKLKCKIIKLRFRSFDS